MIGLTNFIYFSGSVLMSPCSALEFSSSFFLQYWTLKKGIPFFKTNNCKTSLPYITSVIEYYNEDHS